MFSKTNHIKLLFDIHVYTSLSHVTCSNTVWGRARASDCIGVHTCILESRTIVVSNCLCSYMCFHCRFFEGDMFFLKTVRLQMDTEHERHNAFKIGQLND